MGNRPNKFFAARTVVRVRLLCIAAAAAVLCTSCARLDLVQSGSIYQAGVAKVDITPAYPIRLCGYASRKAPSDGVKQKIWCKALALQEQGGEPAILIALDNTAIPWSITQEVAKRLHDRAGIDPQRLAISASHTHSSPCLTGAIPNMFGEPIPDEDRAVIATYTDHVIDSLERAALEALDARQPARLRWNQGRVGFAKNRRTEGGPVDHSLPVMQVVDADGAPLAIWTSYACHCTTLGWNYVHGDWAGCAQEYIEAEHPGAIALVSIGCGADANPLPRRKVELAEKYGHAVADEVSRLLMEEAAPLAGAIQCRMERIELAFDTLPTRADWEKRASQEGATAYHASRNLERLDSGEGVPETYAYPIQTWTFGDDLAVLFLGGEVVVDYSLRLKSELDAERFWINAYSNDVACYVPSRRILREGGYEADSSMLYYDWPTRFAMSVEERIIQTVHELIPDRFRFAEERYAAAN